MGDGLAHRQVAQVGVVEVEDQLVEIPGIFVAPRFQTDVGERLEALQVAQRNGTVAGQIDRAGLQRGGTRGRIGDELGDDAVEVGPRSVPVVRVALQQDVAAADPFLEDKGPRAHRRVVGGVGELITDLEKVPRQDGRLVGRQRAQQIGRRGRQAQAHGRGIRRLGLLHIGESPPAIGVVLLEEEDGEGDVGGGQGLAVMPRHALADLEGVVQSVGRDLPLRRQPGNGAPVEIEQAFVDLGADRARRPRGLDGGGQQGRLGIEQPVERAAAARRGLGRRRLDAQRRRQAAGRGGAEEATARGAAPEEIV
ncbi:MAG: hypothetical protein GAK30_02681 [Paracidovorax wautersii]|uniref:Uncharacterized protein n=1 Tax=Paracidovorax wautersii TaxID=1177982 RepID=A0A7V8JPV9_9BURK|nr:MAG: hypothetical protein GAK30_02681 [Paracidovorax wautersii]